MAFFDPSIMRRYDRLRDEGWEAAAKCGQWVHGIAAFSGSVGTDWIFIDRVRICLMVHSVKVIPHHVASTTLGPQK